jgi:hypothetical protein
MCAYVCVSWRHADCDNYIVWRSGSSCTAELLHGQDINRVTTGMVCAEAAVHFVYFACGAGL